MLCYGRKRGARGVWAAGSGEPRLFRGRQHRRMRWRGRTLGSGPITGAPRDGAAVAGGSRTQGRGGYGPPRSRSTGRRWRLPSGRSSTWRPAKTVFFFFLISNLYSTNSRKDTTHTRKEIQVQKERKQGKKLQRNIIFNLTASTQTSSSTHGHEEATVDNQPWRRKSS